MRRSAQDQDRADHEVVEYRTPGKGLRLRHRFRRAGARVRDGLLPFFSLLLLVAMVVVPIGLFGWFLFFTDVFVVQAVTVVDARDHTMAAAQQIVKERIDSLPFDKNIFFVDTESLETAIIAELPHVQSVFITRKLPGTIKAVVQEKTPTMLLLSGGTYYFVDAQGVAYEEASLDRLPGIALPTVKNDDREAPVQLGVGVVAESFVTFVELLEEQLPDTAGAQVAEIHIPSLAAREVHVILGNNWRILFDATRPAESQVTVLRTLLTESIAPEEVPELEYVDLRIPQRVYFKMRNAHLGEVEG